MIHPMKTLSLAGSPPYSVLTYWSAFRGRLLARMTSVACAGVGQSGSELSGYRGDGVEVFIDVQDGQTGKFGGGRNDEVGDRGAAMLATVSEEHLDFQRAVLNFWR